jgi:hypothetical protein
MGKLKYDPKTKLEKGLSEFYNWLQKKIGIESAGK